MSKLIKNTFIYTIGNSLPMAATFLLLPLYTKYLSPNEYGIVGSMDAIKIFFTILFSLCIERGIVRLYWDNITDNDKKNFLGVVFISLIIIASTNLIIVLLLKNYFQLIYKNIPFFPYFFITILNSFLLTFEHLPKLYYRLKEKAYSFVLLSIIYFLLSTILIIWFIVINRQGALGYLKGQLYASIAMSILYIYISFKISNISFNVKIVKNLLFFTIPFIPPLFISWFLNQSNRIFLENSDSLESVGIFSFSNKISIATSLFTTALMVSFEPNFYKYALVVENGKKKIFNFFNIFILISIFSSFTLVFFSKEGLVLFFNKKYQYSYNIIALITLANLFGTGTGITSLFFQQSKKMFANMIISLTVAIVIFILNYTLIPKFHLYGAAISLLIATIYAFLTSYFYAKRNTFFVELPLLKYLVLILKLILLFLVFDYFGSSFNFYLFLICKFIFITTILYFFFKKFKKEIFMVTKKMSN